MSRIKHTL